MKLITALILVMCSSMAAAERPDCSYIPGGCVGNPPGLYKGPDPEFASVEQVHEVPVPGTLALLSLGITGLLVITRRRK